MIDPSRVGIALPLTAEVESTTDLVREAIREVEVAEEAGLGLVFVPEHRQGPDVSLVAPLTLSAALCGRTERIMVATGVLIAPVHHPVHLAEQVVMLDHISQGRFALGVGAGYQEVDFAPFGVPLDGRGGRLEHTLQALDLLLTRSPASHQGAYGEFEDVELRPRPLSTPRPPIWIGAWSPAGIERTARHADAWIADPIRTVTEVTEMAERYRDACARFDTSSSVVIMREAWIDEDEATAAARFAPVIEPIYRYYRRRGAYTDGPADGSGVRFEGLAQDRLVYGSPGSCAQQVTDIADRAGADHVVLHVRHPGGPTHEEACDSIRALGAALRAPNGREVTT